MRLLEVALLLGHREAVGVLESQLAQLAGVAGTVAGTGDSTCIGRHLGAAAVLLGNRQKARGYYAQALTVATRIPHRPEIALIRFQMAELCLEEADDVGAHGVRPDAPVLRREAQDHLDFCIPEFRDMKMRPALERAGALRARLTTE